MPAVAEPPHAAAVAARPVAHKVEHKPATAARVVNPWVVTLSVMLATFMEILDTTVVNASIPHISGNLSATVDEGTWTVTSYLVANAIVLPMSGWLANYFGRRRVLMTCVIGFSAASVLCGLATSLNWLIFFRVLQGLTGGGMQPLAQSIMLEAFPREKHGHAMAAYGVGVILAPILGPALGGWITDNYSWRWIFYLNVPVGLLSLVLMSRYVFDPSYIKRTTKRVDLWGIGFLALGIGMLQVILDTGQRKDWFSSSDIRTWTVLCVAGLILFLWRELTTREPIVNLRVLRDPTYSAGVFLMTLLGFVLYASLVLLPIYLQTLLGYPAFQAGLAISPRGLGALLTTPLAGVLTHKLGPRKLLVFGFTVGAFTMWQLAGLNLNAGYWDVFWPQVTQGCALSFLFIPLMAATMSRIRKEHMGNATSIFNLMRNIGGSFGIALMTTFLARRNQVHQNHLISNINIYDPETWRMLQSARAWFQGRGSDAYTATQQAYGAIYGMVQRHAAMLSFVEAFWVMAVLFALMVPVVFILRPAPLHENNTGPAH
ncbi:MAG: DHA2 family efflux MFS transporter permease subunit [Terriglobales bacterium]